MELSVVIVNWNSGEYLARLIDSLSPLRQDLVRVVVVDNASDDSSLEGLDSSDELTVLRLKENFGFAGAANLGISECESAYVLLLNPDLRVIPEAVRSLYDLISRNSTAAIVCGALLDEEGESQREFQIRSFPTTFSVISDALFFDELIELAGFDDSPPVQEAETEPEPVAVDQPAAAFWLVRRRAWDSIAGFDEEFHPAWFEDVDFCRRIKDQGWQILYVPQPCARHKGGASLQYMSQREFVKHYYQNLLVYWRKHHMKTFPLVWPAVKLGVLIRLLFICQ